MSANLQLPRGSRIWPRLGAIIVAGVCLYYLYVAINTIGLSPQTGVATVLDKAYYEPGTSYQTLRIGGKAFIRPYENAEYFVLKLQLDGQESAAAVDKRVYENVDTNSRVGVTYQHTRITGVLRVVEVSISAGKEGN